MTFANQRGKRWIGERPFNCSFAVIETEQAGLICDPIEARRELLERGIPIVIHSTCEVHHVPGRLRIKNPLFRENEDRLDEICSCLRDIPGIRQVNANPQTGSVIILYNDTVLEPQKILSQVEECRNVEFPCASAWNRSDQRQIPQPVRSAGSKIGKIVFKKMVEQGAG